MLCMFHVYGCFRAAASGFFPRCNWLIVVFKHLDKLLLCTKRRDKTCAVFPARCSYRCPGSFRVFDMFLQIKNSFDDLNGNVV